MNHATTITTGVHEDCGMYGVGLGLSWGKKKFKILNQKNNFITFMKTK